MNRFFYRSDLLDRYQGCRIVSFRHIVSKSEGDLDEYYQSYFGIERRENFEYGRAEIGSGMQLHWNASLLAPKKSLAFRTKTWTQNDVEYSSTSERVKRRERRINILTLPSRPSSSES